MRNGFVILLALIAAWIGVAPDRAVGAERPRPSIVVTIRGGAFTPAKVTLKPGEMVVWINGDDRDHTVTAASGVFSSGNIRPGGSFAWRATKGGDHAYSCSLHPRMRGVVSVQ